MEVLRVFINPIKFCKSENNIMDLKKLNEFLVNAHINGYASSGEGGEKNLSDGGKELEYREGLFFARDRYFGSNPFGGEEVVFYRRQPVWLINYYGKVITESASVTEVYLFLKEALKKVPKNKPYRGPDNFKSGNFEYFNKVEGTVEKFVGEEEIFYKKELVYILKYHGGLISK